MSMDYAAPFFEKPTVKFVNGASEAIPPHAVMEITSAARDSTTGEIIYTVGKPSSTFRRYYLVNGVMEVGASTSTSKHGEGSFLLSGGAVLYDSADGTPALGESWGAKASQWTLAKNRPGFLVTGANNTTATNPYTSAVQEIVQELIGKPDANIAKGASGTVSVWTGPEGSEVDSTINVTARAKGAAVTASKFVIMAYINGQLYVAPWES